MERIPLPNGTHLHIGGSEYVIKGVLSNGGSCLAYSAYRHPSSFEQKIGMPLVSAVIKEFYPLAMVESLAISRLRNETALEIPAESRSEFNRLCSQFERGAVRQVEFYAKADNCSFVPSRIDCANGTVYSVTDSVKGNTLNKVRSQLDSYDFAEILVALRNVVKRFHDVGLFCLDLKPSNIWVFEKDGDLSQRMALFDFDTVIPIDDIDTAEISFSFGWSAPELLQGERNKIGTSSDVYSFGLLLFWYLMDKLPTDSVLWDIELGDYSFLDSRKKLANATSAKENVKNIFAKTLRHLPSDRAQRVEEV